MHLNVKLKRKQTLLGFLKAVAYLAGYPLMVLFVAIGSVPFMKESAYSGTWYLGIVVALIPWVVSVVLQIVLGCFARNQYFKTLVVGIVSTACVLGSALAIDLHGQQVIADMNKKYVATTDKDGNVGTVQVEVPIYRMGDDGKVETVTWTMSEEVSFNTINYLKGYYVPIGSGSGLAGTYASDLDRFKEIYHVGSGENKTENGGYVTNSDLSKGKIDSATGIAFNPNGVVSECYVYSAEFAMNVLISYNEAINKFATLTDFDMTPYVEREAGESDKEYAARIKSMTPQQKLEAVYERDLALVKESPQYKQYQTTEEYKAAYGRGGTASKVMLSVEKVEEMAPVLIRYIAFLFERGQVLSELYPEVVKPLLNVNLLLETLDKPDFKIDDLQTWFLDPGTGIGGLMESFLGISKADIASMLTEENLRDIIDQLFYYYSPTVRPAFDFFGEATIGEGTEAKKIGTYVIAASTDGSTPEISFTAEDMRAFAYARYYAKTNGAVIGSVLVADDADGNIGQITLTDKGYPASFSYSLASIYQLKADSEYIPSLFPLLAARRYLYIFAGLIMLSIVLYYQFARREDEVIASIVVNQSKEGGAK
jgi:hypothetical protein